MSLSETQKLVCAVSGYNPSKGMYDSNAAYFKVRFDERLDFLREFSENSEEIDDNELSYYDLKNAVSFLGTQFEDNYEEWDAFKKLGEIMDLEDEFDALMEVY